MTKRILILGLLITQILSYGQTKTDEDPRRITDIKASRDGTIQWSVTGETTKQPYVVEQFRWNKWIKVGEVNGVGSPGQNIYSFTAIPYNGENLCRVRPLSSSTDAKEVKWATTRPTIKFTINKKESKIEFNDEQSHPVETMYEIIDGSGTLVKKGWSQSVSFDNLPKGKYTLNYDNTSGEFKR